MTERNVNIEAMRKLSDIEHLMEPFDVQDHDEITKALRNAGRQLKHFNDLLPYLTRGGFIKDKDGTWCKHGDKILIDTNEMAYTDSKDSEEKKPDGTIEGFLTWPKNANFFLRTVGNDWIEITGGFKLLQSCQPDACKGFLGEDDGTWN